MKPLYVNYIAGKLKLRSTQVENCLALLEEGCTVPFISRYRKERTGGMTDIDVEAVKHYGEVFSQMDKRKESILETIEEAGKLTPELRGKIDGCVDASELEDLYLPYRPKRKTRATEAAAKGLTPLADAIWNQTTRNPAAEASKYVSDNVDSVEAALAGARDIIAERLSETALIREDLREIFRSRRLVTKVSKSAASDPEAAKYRTYFEFASPIRSIPPHNLLAILRAENEGFLSVKVDASEERCGGKMYYDYCKMSRYPIPPVEEQIRLAVDDAYKRLLEPSISKEVIREAKEKADAESVEVFGENLRQLLLSAPVGAKRIMAIDPGFRTGCKVVCLDAKGDLLHNETIFPHPPVMKKVQAVQAVSSMVERYGIEVIAVGEGTAGRETVDFLSRCGLPSGVRICTVSEDGASIYSASDVGREEFPDYDVTVRGAVSIGRRLMDPLSELVKIDPKSLGVGQYQHDVDQGMLKEKLDYVVESCVNNVGVDLNTASPYLLRYVSGIGPVLASNIVTYRAGNGPFRSRDALLKVPRLGEKAYQQCAGFLRIRDGKNPLDASAVHPESYHIVEKMAGDLGVSIKDLVGNKELCSGIDPERYVDDEFGLPTVRDIISELIRPGRDPRTAGDDFSFDPSVRSIEDLYEGQVLAGRVTNITDFGAFVDIGIHENGLIHVSKMGVPRGTPPVKVLKLRQPVKVEVISVDLERGRIGLGLIKD